MELAISIIEKMNWVIGILFTVCYAYQIFYVLVPFIIKHKPHKETKLHRIGVLISARNESSVIGQLIDSISEQDYPEEYLRVFVVADNCNDDTAEICRKKGATVYERFNTEKVGKGYALDYLLEHIDEDFGLNCVDAFIVLDADNLLEPDYVTEMNKTYCDGYKIITSYRNSKNYGDNWISAGYALWFIRESKYLNNSRALLNTSCAVSGTGFLFDRQLIQQEGGWHFYLLTEDIEFTTHNISKGIKVGFCGDAMLYDEQPVKFSQSWKQRMRWSRGFLQVISRYGGKLFKGVFTGKGTRFSCFDMLMTLAPAYILSTLGAITTVIGMILGVCIERPLFELINGLLILVFGGYGLMFGVGLITVITEWKKIHTSALKKIFYLFTFPIFMFTYIPISIVALFKKVGWAPIAHTRSVTVTQIKKEKV